MFVTLALLLAWATVSLWGQAASEVDLIPPGSVARSAEGLQFEYVLRRAATSVVLQVVDARERVVRDLHGDLAAGRHRLDWDLRHAPPGPVEGLPPGTTGMARGPRAVPGHYTVRLQADASRVERTLIIERDVAAGKSEADLLAQLELGLEIRDRMSQAAQAVVDLRLLKRQVAERVPLARSPAVGLAADVVTRRLTQVEQPLLSDAWADLRSRVEAGDRRPGPEERQAFTQRAAAQDAAVEAVRAVVGNEIAAFNTLLSNGGLKPLELPPTLPTPR
jgi:hypothetical protein